MGILDTIKGKKGEKGIEVMKEAVGEKVKEVIENATNILAPVKQRTIDRYKQLLKASKWKHKKIIRSGQITWEDYPPREAIGKLAVTINGGIGKINYVRFLVNPKNQHPIKEVEAGNIICAYVEEIINPAKPIQIETTKVDCPSPEEAMKNMQKVREDEKERINAYRGRR